MNLPLYDVDKQWRQHEAGGVGGEAHAAWLSGEDEWLKYLRGQSRTLDEMLKIAEEEKGESLAEV